MKHISNFNQKTRDVIAKFRDNVYRSISKDTGFPYEKVRDVALSTNLDLIQLRTIFEILNKKRRDQNYE